MYIKTAIEPGDCVRQGWRLIKGDYFLFVGICTLGFLLGGAVPMGVLMGPMFCGIFLSFTRKARGESVTFSTLFDGFNYFGPGLVAWIVTMLVFIAVAVASFIPVMVLSVRILADVDVTQPSNLIVPLASAFLFLYSVNLCVYILFMFVFKLIVDRNLPPMEAVKLSVRAAAANFPGLLGLLCLLSVMGFAGMLCLYFGVFFVLPVLLAAETIAYRKIFPEPDEPEARAFGVE